MQTLSSSGMFLGRLAIAILFLIAGIHKFMDPQGTAGYMAAKGMTMVPFFLYAAAILEFLGGLFLLIGWKTRFAALLLILFLIPVTAIFHDFWDYQGADRQTQMGFFFSNIALIGGLLYILSCGAGGLSCDALNKKY